MPWTYVPRPEIEAEWPLRRLYTDGEITLCAFGKDAQNNTYIFDCVHAGKLYRLFAEGEHEDHDAWGIVFGKTVRVSVEPERYGSARFERAEADAVVVKLSEFLKAVAIPQLRIDPACRFIRGSYAGISRAEIDEMTARSREDLAQRASARILACAERWARDEPASLAGLPYFDQYDAALPRSLVSLRDILGIRTGAFLRAVSARACRHTLSHGPGPAMIECRLDLFFLPVTGPEPDLAGLAGDPAARGALARAIAVHAFGDTEASVTLLAGVLPGGTVLTLKTIALKKALAWISLTCFRDGLDEVSDTAIADALAHLAPSDALPLTGQAIVTGCLVGVGQRLRRHDDTAPCRRPATGSDSGFHAAARGLCPRLTFGDLDEPLAAAGQAILHQIQTALDQQAAMHHLPPGATADRIDTYRNNAGLDVVATYGAVRLGVFGLAHAIVPFALRQFDDAFARRSKCIVHHDHAPDGSIKALRKQSHGTP